MDMPLYKLTWQMMLGLFGDAKRLMRIRPRQPRGVRRPSITHKSKVRLVGLDHKQQIFPLRHETFVVRQLLPIKAEVDQMAGTIGVDDVPEAAPRELVRDVIGNPIIGKFVWKIRIGGSHRHVCSVDPEAIGRSLAYARCVRFVSIWQHRYI